MVENGKEQATQAAALEKFYIMKVAQTLTHKLLMMVNQTHTLGSSLVLQVSCTFAKFSPREGSCIASYFLRVEPKHLWNDIEAMIMIL